MRSHRKIAVLVGLMVAAAMASTPVLSGSRDIFVSQDSSLNGTDVPRGAYHLSWRKNGSGDTVKLSLFQGVTLVASAEGRLVDGEAAGAADSLVYKVGDDGKRQIVGLRFGGKSREIEIAS